MMAADGFLSDGRTIKIEQDMSMDPAEQRDDRVMSLVAEALKTPLRERDRFLLSACQTDTDLYREVTEILNWEDQMGDFLSRPLVDFIDLDALEQIFKPEQMVADRFQIIRRVGDGGMGVVYEAFDHIRQRRIAIKCPKLGYESMLPQELNALDVHHKNVCLVNDIHSAKTELGEVRFLTMEFLDGETLAHKLENGRLKEADAWQIARQLCSGLAEAARSNILHRDLKPGNIVLCPQKDGSTRAVITDFGLAVEASEVKELEGGTPSYMAPELWRGSNGTQASDVFSLGVILYEMVTGSKPFPALNKENVTFPTPVAPSKIVKKLPRRWDDAILPCLRENPGERCSAEDVLAVLERKAFYRKPAVLVAIAACLLLALKLSIPPIIAYFTPAPVRLAILPPQGPSDDLIQQALDKLPSSIKSMQTGTATVSVIPLSRTLEKQVTSHEQAEKVLDATHVLQLTSTKNDTGSVMAQGAIINLKTGETVGNYPAHLVDSDLPIGLTGTVAFALDVPRTAGPETVAPAAKAAYKNGHDCLEARDFACAIPQFQAARQLDPHSALPLAGLAKAYARKSQAMSDADSKAAAMQEAKTFLTNAEAVNADSPAVRLASGLLHQIDDKDVMAFAMALPDFQRVEKIQPDNVEAWLGSGVSYEEQSTHDKVERERMHGHAIHDYSQAIALEPNSVTYSYLASFYENSGDYIKAEETYRLANQLDSKRVGIYGSLAAPLIAQGKDSKARAMLTVLEQAPPSYETAVAWNNDGALYAMNGQDIEAIRCYQKAVQQFPNYPMYWLNLADSQRRTKRLNEAKTSYNKGFSLADANAKANPTSAAALASLAYAEVRFGLQNKAASDVAHAMDLPGLDDSVLISVVETYEALGDRNGALKAATLVSNQTLKMMQRRPDLAGLCHDPGFNKLSSTIDAR